MLKTIPPILTPDLPCTLQDVTPVTVLKDVLRDLPVDDFIEAPVVRMVPDGKAAAEAFAVLAMTDGRPHGCFILAKGMVRGARWLK